MPKAHETVQQIMDMFQVLKAEIQLAIEEAVAEERARITIQNEVRVAALIAQGEANNRKNAEAFRAFERDRCVALARNFRWNGSPDPGEAIARILEEPA